MKGKITRKQQAANIIEWLERLPNFKKTVKQLGFATLKPTGKVDWKYCCLGVACRVQKLQNIDFDAGYEASLIETLCLRASGRFDMPVMVKVPEHTWDTAVISLVNSNDIVFQDDRGFARQRAFMLLTTNRWIANDKVAAMVNRHFAKERKELAKTIKFKIKKY